MGHQYIIVLAAAAVALALLACLSASDTGPSADLEGAGGSARRLLGSNFQDPKTVAPRGAGWALWGRTVEEHAPDQGRWASRKIGAPWTKEEHGLFLAGLHRHPPSSYAWQSQIANKFLAGRRSTDEVGEHWREYAGFAAGEDAGGGGPAALDRGGVARIRVVSWNVACGMYATPEEIAEALRPLDPDVVLLCEAPRANPGEEVEDWSHRLAKALGLPHVHVGTQSSSGHKAPDWMDTTGRYGGKFKSVLSKTPLSNGADIKMEGSGWGRVSAVRVETEMHGRKFALYSLHLPGYAHHNHQPNRVVFWEKSKQKHLANHINAEDASYNVVVGGDFNEWGDELIMPQFMKATGLEDTVTARSIDHLLYSTGGSVRLVDADRVWAPKNEDNTNLERGHIDGGDAMRNAKDEGLLSDHPFVWCELEIPAPADNSPFANEPGALDPEDLKN